MVLSLFSQFRNWALSLSGGNAGNGFDMNKLWSGFQISIVLTDDGFEHVMEVRCMSVFVNRYRNVLMLVRFIQVLFCMPMSTIC